MIDIRALASLTQVGYKSAPQGGSRSLAAGPSAGSFSVPQRSPFGAVDSLTPFERPQRSGSSKALPIAIVMGSTMIAAAAFLAVFLTRKEAAATATPVEALAPVAAAAAAVPDLVPTPTAAPGAAADAPAADEPAAAPTEQAQALVAADEPDAKPDAEESAKDDEHAASRTTASSSSRSSGKGKSSPKARSASGSGGGGGAKAAKVAEPKDDADDALLAKPAAPAEEPKPKPATDDSALEDLMAGDKKPAAAEEPKPKPAPAGKRSIDDLLDSAVAKSKADAAEKSSGGGGGAGLPEAPGRDEVKSAMQGLESEVRACADGQTLDAPTATVAVTVASSGRVQSVRVTGNQGTVGSCIAKVVRGAKFSAFSKPTFTFNFPYKLK